MTAGLSRVPAGEVVEPVSLADAKLHLRVDGTADDVLIGSMITSARMSCEGIAQRSVVAQTWVLTQSSFRHPWLDRADRHQHAYSFAPWHRSCARAYPDSVVLPMAPVRSVASVVYLAPDGSRVEMPSGSYRLAVVGDALALLRPVGAPWPRTAHEPDAVTVTYDAGFDKPGDVPGNVVSWIKLRIGALYENREEYAAGQPIPQLGFADRLLDQFSIPVV